MNELTEGQKIAWKRFCEMATWTKIRTAEYEKTGDVAIREEHGMGVALSITERGTWCLAKNEEEIIGAVWQSIDEEGFVQIAIGPLFVCLKD